MAPRIHYRRTPERTVVDSSGVRGWRGILSINGAAWPTIEREDLGRDDDGAKALPPGLYRAEFGRIRQWRATSVGRVIRESHAIRVLGDYSRGRIYVHIANFPRELAGCIAPGCTEIRGGVGRSKRALEQIFAALGGWVLGEPLELEVEGEFLADRRGVA